MKLVVHGATDVSEVPGLKSVAGGLELTFAPDGHALAEQLPGAEILLGWDFRGKDLAECWHLADNLEWIHWCGAGVDALLFPGLIDSNVVLTNSRGLYDRAIAEYVLGYMICEVKLFRETLELHKRAEWRYRLTGKLAGQKALVFGVGSIGREIAKLLQALGVSVSGVGRSARNGDDSFDAIHAAADAVSIVGTADWVIGVMPGTPQTDRFFASGIFAAMKPSARFINVGRGRSVDEQALVKALNDNMIAGAMLDVFDNEPLPPDSPLWQAPNLVVSPHMAGDYYQHQTDSAGMFFDNLSRYQAGQPLNNVVDKMLGFVASRPETK